MQWQRGSYVGILLKDNQAMSRRVSPIFLLSLVLLLSIFQGCSRDGNTDPASKPETATLEKSPEDKVSVDDAAKENTGDELNSTKSLGERLGEANQKAEQAVQSAKTKLWDGVKSTVEPLTEADIRRYIQAYKNFAKISAQLEEERKKCESILIFTCPECRVLLNKAAQDAGYPSFESFLIMDVRIHYTMRSVAYLRIADLAGKTLEELSVDALRDDIRQNQELAQEKKVQVSKLSLDVASLDTHVSRIASFATSVSKQLLQQADLDLVAKHFDEILKALTNPDLPVGLRHTTGGGDWDD